MYTHKNYSARSLTPNGLGESLPNPVQSFTEVHIPVKLDKKVAILTSIFVTEDDRIMFSGADRYLVHLYGFLEESGYCLLYTSGRSTNLILSEDSWFMQV